MKRTLCQDYIYSLIVKIQRGFTFLSTYKCLLLALICFKTKIYRHQNLTTSARYKCKPGLHGFHLKYLGSSHFTNWDLVKNKDISSSAFISIHSNVLWIGSRILKLYNQIKRLCLVFAIVEAMLTLDNNGYVTGRNP